MSDEAQAKPDVIANEAGMTPLEKKLANEIKQGNNRSPDFKVRDVIKRTKTGYLERVYAYKGTVVLVSTDGSEDILSIRTAIARVNALHEGRPNNDKNLAKVVDEILRKVVPAIREAQRQRETPEDDSVTRLSNLAERLDINGKPIGGFPAIPSEESVVNARWVMMYPTIPYEELVVVYRNNQLNWAEKENLLDKIDQARLNRREIDVDRATHEIARKT